MNHVIERRNRRREGVSLARQLVAQRTQEETATLLCISKQAVAQIEAMALSKISRRMRMAVLCEQH